MWIWVCAESGNAFQDREQESQPFKKFKACPLSTAVPLSNLETCMFSGNPSKASFLPAQLKEALVFIFTWLTHRSPFSAIQWTFFNHAWWAESEYRVLPLPKHDKKDGEPWFHNPRWRWCHHLGLWRWCTIQCFGSWCHHTVCKCNCHPNRDTIQKGFFLYSATSQQKGVTLTLF